MTANSENLSQRTAKGLEELIVEQGWFLPGQQIPNETELAETFSVSRATLREAVKILVARGILEVRRGTGTFVAEMLPDKSSIDMPDMSRMITEVRDLYEVRLLFEPQVAELACIRATEQELEGMQKLCDKMEKLSAAGEDVTEADIAFHSSLMRASHNEFIQQLLPVIRRALSDRRVLDAQAKMTQEVPNHRVGVDHDGIMRLMRARDSVGVRCAMYIHLDELLKEFDRYSAK
jgi:GntR family transcriptional repressor for pyruvate dehydrogenase complex